MYYPRQAMSSSQLGRIKGKVKWFSQEIGKGVIVKTDTNEEVVVNQPDIVDHNTKRNLRYLLPDEEVEFNAYYRNGILTAAEVTGPGRGMLQCNIETVNKNLLKSFAKVQLTNMTYYDTEYMLSKFFTNEELQNYYNKYGDNDVHVAVRRNLSDLLNVFAKRNDWVKLCHKQNYDSLTPLHLAVKLGFTGCVKVLIKCDQNASKMKNYEGDTPLHTAISFGQEEIGEMLLMYPTVDPSLLNNDGNNALHLAVAKGQLRVTEMILHLQPELVNVFNKNGFSPLHSAIFNTYDKITDYFIREVLCNKNARVMKHRSYCSFTPLQLAVIKMQPSIIEKLVECGVDLNLTEDKNGCTALHLAVDNLISCKGCGVTADRLFYLQEIEWDQLNMDELLERAGKCLPLAICCYLLGKGADLNFKNNEGWSSLQMLPEPMRKFAVVFKSFTLLHQNSQLNVPVAFFCKSPNFVEGDTNCYLCNDAPSTVRFEPCNHILYCTNCIQVVAGRIQKCIRCDREIVAKIGPKGEIRFDAQLQKVDSVNDNGGDWSYCTLCFEKPKTWMVPACGHPLCEKCCHLVNECHKCGSPIVDLRQVFLG